MRLVSKVWILGGQGSVLGGRNSGKLMPPPGLEGQGEGPISSQGQRTVWGMSVRRCSRLWKSTAHSGCLASEGVPPPDFSSAVLQLAEPNQKPRASRLVTGFHISESLGGTQQHEEGREEIWEELSRTGILSTPQLFNRKRNFHLIPLRLVLDMLKGYRPSCLFPKFKISCLMSVLE